MLAWAPILFAALHITTDSQTEKINQILEDMLRACVLAYPQKWDQCLPLAEFSYNNSYQESIKMTPFEALYGRRCRTPLNWSEAGERTLLTFVSLVKQYGERTLLTFVSLVKQYCMSTMQNTNSQ